jgi:hypothetical protein
MVRRRFFSAVSNHECPEPSFETRPEAAPQDEGIGRSNKSRAARRRVDVLMVERVFARLEP